MKKAYSILFILSILIVSFSCQKDPDQTENQVPVANAGPAQSITISQTLTLSGSGTDADGQVVAYLWSQVKGPSSVVIETPGSPVTTVTNFTTGYYLFQLMVTDDKGAVGVDTISVTVGQGIVTLNLQPSIIKLKLQFHI